MGRFYCIHFGRGSIKDASTRLGTQTYALNTPRTSTMSGGGFFSQQGSQNNTTEASDAPVRAVRTLLLGQLDRVVGEGDGPVYIDNHPASQGVLCAMLRNIYESNNNAKMLDVSDTTGEAELRYRDTDPENSDADKLNDYLNQYVKLYGQFRTFNENTSFDVFRVEPVEDVPLGVVYHEIEAAREWYHYSDLIPIGSSLNDSLDNTSQPTSNGNENQPLFAEDPVEDQSRIMELIKSNDSESGATLEQISHNLGLAEARVRTLLDQLVGSGVLYELNDEYHSTV